jgi:hypothetical protein
MSLSLALSSISCFPGKFPVQDISDGFGIRFIAYMKVRHQFIFCEEACAQIISMPHVLQYMGKKCAVDVQAVLVEETERHMVWKLKTVPDA